MFEDLTKKDQSLLLHLASYGEGIKGVTKLLEGEGVEIPCLDDIIRLSTVKAVFLNWEGRSYSTEWFDIDVKILKKMFNVGGSLYVAYHDVGVLFTDDEELVTRAHYHLRKGTLERYISMDIPDETEWTNFWGVDEWLADAIKEEMVPKHPF